jgi:hypothetical protein
MNLENVVCTNYTKLLGENMNAIKKAELLLQSRKEIGLEGNTDKTRGMRMSQRQNQQQSPNITQWIRACLEKLIVSQLVMKWMSKQQIIT